MPDRMSDAEALMWMVEKDPALRSDFLNITILEAPPDWTRLMAKVGTAIELLPRLRQRVVSAPLRLAPPQWVDDPQFDLGYHVRRVAVPTPGGMRELLDLAATFAMDPFDRARPLWEFVIIEGLEEGRAALLQKIHHTITDGVGGLKLTLALLDLEADPAQPPTRTADLGADDQEPPPGTIRETPFDVVVETAAYLARRSAADTRRVVNAVLDTATHPAALPDAVSRAAHALRSLRDQAFIQGGALSPLMTDRSLARRFESFSVPLDRVKATSKATGTTVNDVYVTGVAGALGRYHERMGMPVDELRMAMPVNLRADDDDPSGNRFAPVRVVVPVGPKDPAAHLQAVSQRLASVRSEPALGLADSLAGFVTQLPTSVLVPIMKSQTRTVDFAASNLRGSPVELFLAGVRILANHPMGPCTGVGINVTCLSYGGHLDMGVNLDPAAVTDPEALMECLAESFDTVTGLAS